MGVFQGVIIKTEKKEGESAKGSWASVSIEIEENMPQNPQYPECGKFEFFKNGDKVHFAADFEQYYPLGSLVEIHYNHKKNTYQDKTSGEDKSYFSLSAWKILMLEKPSTFQAEAGQETEADDDLPF